MIVRKFTAAKDPEYGNFGFKPAWIANANSSDGRGCAHDILEHGLHEPNPLVGELLAMGRSIYVRSMPGWYYRELPLNVNTSAGHVGSTVAFVMREERFGGHDDHILLAPPVVRPINDEYVEKEIAEIMVRARKDLIGEAPEHPMTDEEQERIVGWLRIGYRRAVRRYGENRENEVSYLFDRVETLVEEKLKNAYEGMELTVRVNHRDGTVTTELSEW